MPTLNLRLAAILLVSVIFVGVGVHLLHGYQVGRQATALKKASERAEEDRKTALEKVASATSAEAKADARKEAATDLTDAIKLLRDYALLARRDRRAELHLGSLYADAGQFGAARDWLEDGLRNSDDSSPPLTPDQVRDGRWTLVHDVLLKTRSLRDFSDAKEHLRNLLDGAVERNQQHRQNREKPEGDPEQLDLYGQLVAVDHNYKNAAEIFEDAIAISPDRVDSYRHLAEARLQLNEKAQADAVMDAMLAKNPKSVPAYEHYVDYKLQRGQSAGDEQQRKDLWAVALAKAQEALKQSPDDPRCLMQVGHCFVVTQDYDKAEEYFVKGIKAAKDKDSEKLAVYYERLIDVQKRLNKPKDVLETLTKAVAATRGLPGGLDLLWQLADAQVRAGKYTEAEANLADLRDENYPRGKTDFVAALAAFQQQNWGAAKKLLEESAIPGTRDFPPTRIQARFLLVECDRQLGLDVNEQLRILQQILEDNPNSYQVHALLAEIYAGQQKADHAIEELARAANCLPANSPQKEDAVLHYLQTLVTAQLRTDEHKRHWEPIVEQLDKFTANKTKRPEYEVLRADILLGQGKPGDAQKALLACINEKPKSPSVWLALVRLSMYQAGAESDAAKKAQWWKTAGNYIDQAEKAIGDGIILRMARGSLALASKDPRTSATLKSLGEKTGAMNDAEKLQLWAMLGSMSEQSGDLDLAQDFFRRQARLDPKNIHVRYRLCELQLRQFEKGRPADPQELDRLVDEIEKLAGQGPYWLYAKAIRAFVQANNKDPKLLLEARGYVQDAMKARSDWAALSVLCGRICELQNEPDQALELYARAVYMQGERDNDVIGRAARLFVRRRRIDEAKAMFDYLESKKSPLLEEMQQEYVFVKVFRGEIDKAEKLVKDSVAADSKNYKDLVRQGEMYAVLVNRLKTAAASKAGAASPDAWKRDQPMLQMAQRANESLAKAVRLDPRSAEAWTALAQLFAEIGQPNKDLIGKIEDNLKTDQDLTTVANCCELLNDPEKAEQKYRAAVKAFPQDSRVIRQAADFYLRHGKPASAEPLLRSIVSLPAPATLVDACWARRRLAELLRARGDFDGLRQALALLDENLAGKAATMEDLRLKARFLLAVPRKESLAEAVKCCELIVRLPYATANDHFVLAQLYLRTGNKAAYEDQMHAIIDPQHPQPLYLMSYINALLDRNELEDADGKLQILEKAAPGSFEAMQFRAEYFFRREQYREAAKRIEEYINTGLDPQSPDRGRQIHRAARLMEEYAARLEAAHKPDSAGFLAKATDVFQTLRNLALDGNMVYAAFCARQGRIDEALSLLEKTWDRSKPETVEQPAQCIIGNPAATTGQLARLEKLLADAHKANYSADLLSVLSALNERRQQYDKAIANYREILAKNPQDFRAMNNLAVDLVHSGGDLNEALELVNRALKIRGPQAAVLDSRAMVLIARQEYDKALVDLNTAVGDEGAADQYFHLAWALSLLDRKSEAADALKMAESKGLDPKTLGPYEKPVYDRLRESL